ncbi:MAG: phosphatase PAP2 family protein [Chitinophagaceae bacterium]|nr:phosphatase PAP2 family protein [Chitinophagaceae bacterium]
MLGILKKIDERLFLFLNGLHWDWLDPYMVLISHKWFWLPMYLVLFFIIFLKKRGGMWKIMVLVVIGVLCADQVTSTFMKPFFERLRPCYEGFSGIHLLGGCGGRFGFASSHAANTFVFFSICFFFLREWKWLFIFLFFWAVLVSYSRIYIGVHYPLDVIVGGFIGFLIGYILWVIARIFSFHT